MRPDAHCVPIASTIRAVSFGTAKDEDQVYLAQRRIKQAR